MSGEINDYLATPVGQIETVHTMSQDDNLVFKSTSFKDAKHRVIGFIKAENFNYDKIRIMNLKTLETRQYTIKIESD
jgi:hypothetical protein